MLTGEVNIGLIPANFTAITQVAVVYCWVSCFVLVLLTNTFIVIIQQDILVMEMRGMI